MNAQNYITNKINFLKLHFKYKKNSKEYFNYYFLVNNLYAQKKSYLSTKKNDINSNDKYYMQSTNYKFSHHFTWHKKMNRKHILRFQATFQNFSNLPESNWFTENNLFSPVIPSTYQERYKFVQIEDIKKEVFNFELKEYWKINGKNHIYTSIGGALSNQNYLSKTYQLLDTGKINDFASKGFNNKFSLEYKDLYFGLQYRIRINKTIITPGIYSHLLTWKFEGNLVKDNSEIKILPQLDISSNINHRSHIKLSYKMLTKPFDIHSYASNYLMKNLHNVEKGQLALTNALYHSISMDCDYFKLSSGIMAFAYIGATRKLASLNKNVLYTGLNQTSFYFYDHTFKDNFNSLIYFRKNFHNYYIELNQAFTYYNDYAIINAMPLYNYSFSYYSHFVLGLFSKKINDLKLGMIYKNSFVKSTADASYYSFSPFIEFFIPYKSFRFSGKYSFELGNYVSINNNRSIFSIAYMPDSNKLSCEVEVVNPFSSSYTNDNYFINDFYTSIQKTYIQAPYLVFKLNYHL